MKHLVKRNSKEISAYWRDKQIECFTFNIIQYHPTTKNSDQTKTFFFIIEAETNKCLRVTFCKTDTPELDLLDFWHKCVS